MTTNTPNTLHRQVNVCHPVKTAPDTLPLHVIAPHEVSGLDLPPALVYRVCTVSGDALEVRWLTDPVDLAHFLNHHPEASVQVMRTERTIHH